MAAFDNRPYDIQANIIRDVLEMVEVECGRQITEEDAIRIARKLSPKTTESIYRVSRQRLCNLVYDMGY